MAGGAGLGPTPVPASPICRPAGWMIQLELLVMEVPVPSVMPGPPVSTCAGLGVTPTPAGSVDWLRPPALVQPVRLRAA